MLALIKPIKTPERSHSTDASSSPCLLVSSLVCISTANQSNEVNLPTSTAAIHETDPLQMRMETNSDLQKCCTVCVRTMGIRPVRR